MHNSPLFCMCDISNVIPSTGTFAYVPQSNIVAGDAQSRFANSNTQEEVTSSATS